ncbi:MAG: nucleotidyltransferase domain-containing protein [Anaerolineales bacterium]|nr:nucleotidyltransferase domain-containing protein [Anaerolineales bacterium]
MKTNKLSTYQTEREQLLKQLTVFLQSDSRIVAAWLFGSLGRNDADELSDVDIWVIVADPYLQEIVEQRRQFVSKVNEPIFFVETPQNAPQDGGYLMAYYDGPTGPHQVDWYWQPQSSTYIPPETVVLFDRIGLPRRDRPIEFPEREPVKEIVENPLHFISFFWAMLLITAKYVVRKPQSKEMTLLPYVLHPFHKTQRLVGQKPTAYLAPQTTRQEKLSILRRLADEMCGLMPQVAARGFAVPDAASTAVYKFLDLVDEVLA